MQSQVSYKGDKEEMAAMHGGRDSGDVVIRILVTHSSLLFRNQMYWLGALRKFRIVPCVWGLGMGNTWVGVLAVGARLPVTGSVCSLLCPVEEAASYDFLENRKPEAELKQWFRKHVQTLHHMERVQHFQTSEWWRHTGESRVERGGSCTGNSGLGGVTRRQEPSLTSWVTLL